MSMGFFWGGRVSGIWLQLGKATLKILFMRNEMRANWMSIVTRGLRPPGGGGVCATARCVIGLALLRPAKTGRYANDVGCQ